MARQYLTLKRVLPSAMSETLAAVGFVLACGTIMTALALRLPLFEAEAAIIARALIGLDPSMPIPQITSILVQVGDALLPDPIAHRAPFILCTVLGGLITLRLSFALQMSRPVAHLGLAWAFTSLLMLGGGALIGPGPVGFLGLSLFAWMLTSLATQSTPKRWGFLWVTTAVMVFAVPELAVATFAVAFAPILLPTCRRWPLNIGYWAVIATAGLLVIPSAQINGMAILWPAISLQAQIGWSSAFILIAVTPPLLVAFGIAVVSYPRSPSSRPVQTLLFLIALSCSISFLASGLRLPVLMAFMPLLSLLAADALQDATSRTAVWLSEHILPFSAAGLIVAFVIWLSSAPHFHQRLPQFQAASGWTAVAMELDALADQNDIGWIATDTAAHAGLIANNLPSDLPIVILGARNDAPVNCTKSGLYLTNQPVAGAFQSFRMLRPIVRRQATTLVEQHYLAVVSNPNQPGLCAISGR